MVPGLTFSENFPLMSVTFCVLFWAAARVGGSPIGAERHSSIDAVSANFVLNPSCIVVMVL